MLTALTIYLLRKSIIMPQFKSNLFAFFRIIIIVIMMMLLLIQFLQIHEIKIKEKFLHLKMLTIIFF